MAYNTVVIKKDANNKPIPQYYNPVTDEYEVLQGTDGAARQVLYGPDGQPISTTEGKLAVRAAELETKIEAVRVLLNTTIKAAPVVGVKTVTTSAAEVFAGASRLANRYLMAVTNESSQIIYWGPSGVTVANGFCLYPGDTHIFRFSPAVATPVYMIAAASAQIRVGEMA